MQIDPFIVSQTGEELFEISVIGSFFEVHVSAVDQILVELRWAVLGELLYRGRQFHVFHDLVFLCLACCLDVLPGQATSEELDKDIAHSLKVIPPAELVSYVGVCAGIMRCAGHAVASGELDVLSGLWIVDPLR